MMVFFENVPCAKCARCGIVANPARLQQAIWNLLRNAVKLTPRGGRISIRTRDEEANWLRIEVTDSGIGIEPAALRKSFYLSSRPLPVAITVLEA